jgi:hypothetical protein
MAEATVRLEVLGFDFDETRFTMTEGAEFDHAGLLA